MRKEIVLGLLVVLGTACSAGSPPTPKPEAVPSRTPSASHPLRNIGPTPRAALRAPTSSPNAGVPAYDLTADLTARRAEAELHLGPLADVETQEGVFLVAAPGGRGTLASVRNVMRRVVQAYFNDRFTRHPERAVSVYLFPTAAPYNAYCSQRWGEPCMSVYGFYSRSERRIVMNLGPGIGTLTHELVHPIVEADFPSAPAWLEEGIASLFEGYTMPAEGEIHGVKNWRYPRLLRALRSPEESGETSLPNLFAMSDEVFRGPTEDLNYATARYLCMWLDQQRLLWPFYRRWRDDVDRDPTGERTFAEIVGTTPSEADAAWKLWVRRLSG